MSLFLSLSTQILSSPAFLLLPLSKLRTMTFWTVILFFPALESTKSTRLDEILNLGLKTYIWWNKIAVSLAFTHTCYWVWQVCPWLFQSEGHSRPAQICLLRSEKNWCTLFIWQNLHNFNWYMFCLDSWGFWKNKVMFSHINLYSFPKSLGTWDKFG